MEYSFNRERDGIIFAQMRDVNASFKDLCAVCDSIRYAPVPAAIAALEGEMAGAAVLYRRHNKYMGSRHELGGRKGRYPMKCAGIVRKVLLNAMANSRNKGFEPDLMVVVHAAANKTNIVRRGPSKGQLFIGGSYGYSTSRSSDIEFAKVEIGIAKGTEKGLSRRMRRAAKRAAEHAQKAEKAAPAKAAKPAAGPVANAVKPVQRPEQQKTAQNGNANKEAGPKKEETRSTEHKAPAGRTEGKQEGK